MGQIVRKYLIFNFDILDKYCIYLIIYISLTYVFISFLIYNINSLSIIIFHFIFYILLISLLFTFLINPGIPKRKYYINNYKNQKSKKNTKCKVCNIRVPKDLNICHCVDCDICIINYDHHCQWTGKCIGKGNSIFFHIFIISLFCYIIISFFNIFLFLNQQLKLNSKYNKNI